MADFHSYGATGWHEERTAIRYLQKRARRAAGHPSAFLSRAARCSERHVRTVHCSRGLSRRRTSVHPSSTPSNGRQKKRSRAKLPSMLARHTDDARWTRPRSLGNRVKLSRCPSGLATRRTMLGKACPPGGGAAAALGNLEPGLWTAKPRPSQPARPLGPPVDSVVLGAGRPGGRGGVVQVFQAGDCPARCPATLPVWKLLGDRRWTLPFPFQEDPRSSPSKSVVRSGREALGSKAT